MDRPLSLIKCSLTLMSNRYSVNFLEEHAVGKNIPQGEKLNSKFLILFALSYSKPANNRALVYSLHPSFLPSSTNIYTEHLPYAKWILTAGVGPTLIQYNLSGIILSG